MTFFSGIITGMVLLMAAGAIGGWYADKDLRK